MCIYNIYLRSYGIVILLWIYIPKAKTITPKSINLWNKNSQKEPSRYLMQFFYEVLSSKIFENDFLTKHRKREKMSQNQAKNQN